MGESTNLYEELKRLATKTNVTVRIGKNRRVVIVSGSDKLDLHPRAAQAYLRARLRAAQGSLKAYK